MGREVRRVPADWQHPRYDEETAPFERAIGRYIPMYDGGYADAAKEFLEKANAEGLHEALEYFGQAPRRADYMPDWPDDQRTHFMMYEDTSEGTPISPAFATTEELARWLADTGASAFGASKATYEQWLNVARGGWAPSMVISDGQMMSGVEFSAPTAASGGRA